MLARHMLGYAPSLVLPALLSFASVFCLTRLLSPESYGHYVLAINAMTMLLGVGFLWLQSAVSRLLPQAVACGNEKKFTATLYFIYAICCAGLLAVAVLIVIIFPLGDWRVAAWFAPPLAILRAFLNINQAFHRNFVRIARYNIIEVGQSIIGLGAAVGLILLLPDTGAANAATGLLMGLALMSLYDWRMLKGLSFYYVDHGVFREIIHFGLPFIVNFGLSFVLSRSDSFLIQIFRSSAEVGIYNAGYALPDRIGQYLFMAVATASLPLTIRRLESEGVEAARDQTYDNGVAMLALVLPACIGLLLVSGPLIAVMVGPEFRAGAVQVMPIITIATILNGLATHYFDHAFHLAKKTRLFFFTLGPAALLNFLANLWAIPRYGYLGAAWTTLGTYALYLLLSVTAGRRIFRIRFPFKPALQIAAVTAVMAAVLLSFDVDNDWTGLAIKSVVGALIYGAGIFAFNLTGLRDRILHRNAATLPATQFSILSAPADIAAITAEWRALRCNSGGGLFGSYEWFEIWRRNLGQKAKLHFVLARDAAGGLKGLLPLCVRRSGPVRIAEWAGYDVFDFGDALAVNAADIAALWRFAQQQGGYDIALIKDVREAALSLPALTQVMKLREQRKNYFLTLDFPSGDAWLAAQSRKLRGDIRRKTEKMQGKGDVAFHLWAKDDLVPGVVIDALYAQKLAWFKANKKWGIFSQPEMKNFLADLAHQAGRDENLYLAWLTCGKAIVACHMGFVQGGVLHLYLTTFDAEYGVFSPGNILMVETIKWAIDAGLRELDFMRGDESYKQRFASGARSLSAFVSGRGLLGRVLVRFYGSKNAGAAPQCSGHDDQ